MKLAITYFDPELPEFGGEDPLIVELVREMPGSDRTDYWLAKLPSPIRWTWKKFTCEVTHIVVVAKWEGTKVMPGVSDLPVEIAFVTDQRVLSSDALDFGKCMHIADALAWDFEAGNKPSGRILRGFIRPAWGRLGKAKSKDSGP
ncbi:MAG: hypothetical protein R3229_09835 [Alphaproteobacteria bacterium]|nr:hypothetical protein [Alphaproteobacteria bacterium]